MDNDDCDDSEGEIGGFKDNYHGQIKKSMLCAQHPQKKDACQVRGNVFHLQDFERRPAHSFCLFICFHRVTVGGLL